MQRRPRSEFLIVPPVIGAAPLMWGVRPARQRGSEDENHVWRKHDGRISVVTFAAPTSLAVAMPLTGKAITPSECERGGGLATTARLIEGVSNKGMHASGASELLNIDQYPVRRRVMRGVRRAFLN